MNYLVSDYNKSGQLVGLVPFDESDWPIAWQWMLHSWDSLADDFMPQNLSLFLDLKAEQNAVHLGVYRDEEIGGLLMCEPKSPYLCQAHAVFRPADQRGYWGPDTLVTALELGKLFAWRAGYSKIASVTFEDNTLMVKLIERVGGILEGRFIDETIKNGVTITLVRHGIFRED